MQLHNCSIKMSTQPEQSENNSTLLHFWELQDFRKTKATETIGVLLYRTAVSNVQYTTCPQMKNQDSKVATHTRN